jgi:hypothetical protein
MVERNVVMDDGGCDGFLQHILFFAFLAAATAPHYLSDPLCALLFEIVL